MEGLSGTITGVVKCNAYQLGFFLILPVISPFYTSTILFSLVRFVREW